MVATTEQIEAFCDYVSAEWSYEIAPDDVTTTRDTLANFVEQWGAPDGATDYGKLPFTIWEDIQTRKGAQRGDLLVMDCGEFRLAYFSGQS